MNFEVSVDIAAAPETVWATLADVERWPEWSASMSDVQRLGDGPFGVGGAARVRQPRLPPTVWRVTEWRPGASFTWVATGPGVTTTAGHRLTPTATGVTVVLSFDQRGPLAPVVDLLLGRLTRRYVGMEAAGLKRRCETAG